MEKHTDYQSLILTRLKKHGILSSMRVRIGTANISELADNSSCMR